MQFARGQGKRLWRFSFGWMPAELANEYKNNQIMRYFVSLNQQFKCHCSHYFNFLSLTPTKRILSVVFVQMKYQHAANDRHTSDCRWCQPWTPLTANESTQLLLTQTVYLADELLLISSRLNKTNLTPRCAKWIRLVLGWLSAFISWMRWGSFKAPQLNPT